MRCIIVDDEPIAREGIKMLVEELPQLELLKGFNNAGDAAAFINDTPVDLIFLDINMPGINGIEFALSIPKQTLVIFTTAYSRYVLDSYEVEAVDYLVKPVNPVKFRKAVNKAVVYHALLMNEEKRELDSIEEEFIFVKSGRKYSKVDLKDILFVEGLKDYVIIRMVNQHIITRMTLKTISELLPLSMFFRINKSYIINKKHIDSFDNNDVFIGDHEIAIGNLYRDEFFQVFASGKL